MKKLILSFLLAASLLLCGCSEYAEPDVHQLVASIVSEQLIELPTEASDEDIAVIFDFDPSEVEDCAVTYSGRGGYADIIAVFKLESADSAEDFSAMLSDYKTSRYEDFKGYAPFEAEKLENGKVMTYGRYVLLAVVPDISKAQADIDAAFKP